MFIDSFRPREFQEWARKNQTEYYRLLVRLMPADVNVNIERVEPFPLDKFKKNHASTQENIPGNIFKTITLAGNSGMLDAVTQTSGGKHNTTPPSILPGGGSEIDVKPPKTHASKIQDKQTLSDELYEGESCEISGVELARREMRKRLGII